MENTEKNHKQIQQAETILVVDAHPADLDLLSDYLKGSGFQVLFARDGEDVFQKAKHVSPDLILIAARRPGLDGFETCRKLKADPAISSIPILLMLALPDAAEKRRVFQSGGVDYLSMPFQREEVLARVRTHLSLRSLQKQLEGQSTNLPPSIADCQLPVPEHPREKKVREALYQIAEAAISSADVDALYRSIHQIVGQLMPAQNFFIALHNPSTNMVHYPYFVDQYDPVPTPELCQGSLTARIIQTGRKLRVSPEVEGELELIGTACVDWLGVPLKVENRTIGMMAVQSYTEQIRYDEKDLELMEFVSTQVAMAIDRKRSFEEIHKHLQRLNALHVIDTACTNNLGLELTLGILLDQTVDQLKVDAADILLLSPDTQMLEHSIGRGFRSATNRDRLLSLSGTWAGQVVLERVALYLYNVAETKWDGDFNRLFAGEEFATYFGVPILANGQVKGVLEAYHRSFCQPGVEWLNFLNALATQAAMVIDNSNMVDALQRSNQELTVAYDATLEGWSYALELRDGETQGHSQRVTAYTLRLARGLNVKPQDLIHIRRGALLHDIGKMGIPDRILLKPGPLDAEEWEIMRKHPIYAYEMLSPIPYLRPALDIPYCHHEKWDGSGYPGGLKGEDIPLAARIFAIVDVWDALSTDRPYRKGWKREEINGYIQEQSGKHFDPQIVETFLSLVQDDFFRY